MSKARSSFTAADAFPLKVLQIMPQCVSKGHVFPIHVQLCPTNKCNLNCSFCSCSEREKGQELALADVRELIRNLASLGTKALTITGGGEPTLYPHLDHLLVHARCYRMSVGLVTNGIAIDRVPFHTLNDLTWCRVSVSDDRDIDQLFSSVTPMLAGTSVDWAFSYVVTARADWTKINRVIAFANTHNFTHVRLVSDLLDLHSVPSMDEVASHITEDDSKVIYQGRKEFVRGDRNCRASLLRPVVAPDGWVYPCCGAQYAIDGSTGYFPEEMRMCRMQDIVKAVRDQEYFDGSVCDRCYYQSYNDLLNRAVEPVEHQEFV